MNIDTHDALMEQLLRELLGGDRPRDMTARVIARAVAYDRFRRRWWIAAGSAMAAGIALALTLWVAWPQKYPAPQAQGIYTIANGGSVQRGARLETSPDESANLVLGDYVEVAMQPETALTIGGAPYQEKIFFEQGHVDVRVAKKKGTFEVAVGPTIIHVTGTQFSVDVDEELMADTIAKSLTIAVHEGSVVVSGLEKKEPVTLLAGSAMDTETFVLSADPVRSVDATAPASPPGAVPGTSSIRDNDPAIDGKVVRPVRPFPPGRGPAATQRQAAALQRQLAVTPLISRPMHVILAPVHLELIGILRQDRGVYFLQTPRGPFLLFPQKTPLTGWQPVLDRRVRVTWDGGQVVKIE